MDFKGFIGNSGPSGPARKSISFGTSSSNPNLPPGDYSPAPRPQQWTQQPQPGRFGISPPGVSSKRRSPTYDAGPPLHSRIHSIEPVARVSGVENSHALNSSTNKRSRTPSPSVNNSEDIPSVASDSKRKSTFPYKLSNEKKILDTIHSPEAHDSALHTPPKHAYSNTPKRSRSPLPFTDQTHGLASSQVNSEREIEAKSRRLERFKVELSKPIQDLTRLDSSRKANKEDTGEKLHGDFTNKENGNSASGGIFGDFEGFETCDAVAGLCPDMCPESEREERERKGDLDKYERLNGERNQTTKYLAVKKYSRTAEREAQLIRPLPVLQKTVRHLLDLLDQPYSDNLLGIYNFLWDRMRAIRTDLRMQHIFNHDAITMLEQMIRLHIIAMHELCEYEKGEGFSEGFDAHLNIEQMNKASVELFQMYDDHRKKGILVQTEREFRGYYALLKLDRHPGYKVEPAELSLDLAKMEPKMRGMPEILFARDVARACRMGNYIAFFRLARKATYLQACLMHAHFAKTRTRALASLHGGLQHNQGIPVQHVIRWLGMEGEDAEALLEYHGFVLRRYEEAYVVKEGSFLNLGSDFPTRSALLVHQKRSKNIINDVCTYQTSSSLEEDEMSLNVVDVVDVGDISTKNAIVDVPDEEMHDYHVSSGLGIPTEQLHKGPSLAFLSKEDRVEAKEVSLSVDTPILPFDFVNDLEKQEDGVVFDTEEEIPEEEVVPSPKLNGQSMVLAATSGFIYSNGSISESPQSCFNINVEDVATKDYVEQEEAISSSVLKKIIRKWRRQTLLRREIMEQRQFIASTALNSLSIGPPLRHTGDQSANAVGNLGIDFARRTRYARQCQSWSRLNVSDLVSSTLSARNPNARCICWKLVVYVQADADAAGDHGYQLFSKWMHLKLLSSDTENDDELLVSSPYLSIWRKWLRSGSSSVETCCLSVVRRADLDRNRVISEDISAGASGIVFLLSDAIPWETQNDHLKRILMSIPSQSGLPLLIVSSGELDLADSFVSIVRKTGFDESRISSASVAILSKKNEQGHVDGFFMDISLRDGLQWMANESPLQPAVHLVKVRQLLFDKLMVSSETLGNLRTSEVGPEIYISAFNEALARSAEDVCAASSINPNHWPCPEIDLLDESSEEGRIAFASLPRTRWSSNAAVEPLLTALKGCTLPSFTVDLSWLNHGSQMAEQVHKVKFALEDCLKEYMAQSSLLLNRDLAAREAALMLQKGATLELRGTSYYIVPKWQLIFQRIYNWQLTKLANLGALHVHVLDSSRPGAAGMADVGYSSFKGRPESLSLSTAPPSLDEMLEMLPDATSPRICPRYASPVVASERGHLSAVNGCDDNGDDIDEDHPASNGLDDALAVVQPGNIEAMEAALLPKASADKLASLLERCRLVQDAIGEKLAIYF